jgi:ADP-ribose pyrophosphatase YjhB (NUDIX family)
MPTSFYCSRCGTELPHVAPVTCTACGMTHWRNPKPCAGALVAHEGKLMLIKRATEPYQGDWDIPGGFLDFGEHPEEAAKREVYEETGLRVRITGLLGIWMDEYGSEPAAELRESTVNIYYHGVLETDCIEIRNVAEVVEIGWFTPEQMPANIAFPRHECSVLGAWKEAFLAKERVKANLGMEAASTEQGGPTA